MVMETNYPRVCPMNIPLNHYKIPVDHDINFINPIEQPNGNPMAVDLGKATKTRGTWTKGDSLVGHLELDLLEVGSRGL
jgi:hypothetical protein